jgi:hypothetical protein
MAVTAHVYTKFQTSAINKLANLTSDALKVMLLSAYTVGSTQDTAQFVSDVLAVGTEASGTGYTAGGQALSGVSISPSGHVVTVTCTSPSWASSTITASYAVFYDSTPGTNSTNPVICYWDFGGAQSSSSGTFTLTISGSGLLTLTGS